MKAPNVYFDQHTAQYVHERRNEDDIEYIRTDTFIDKEIYNDAAHSIISKQEEPASRTSNDIEAAMQEVKEKSKTFTEANKGKSSEQILAEMRGEEPVSDLEEEIEKCIESLIPETELNSTTPFALEYVVELLQKAFKAGTEWQKQQDQSTIELAEDHAILAGMNRMEEQIMSKAKSGIGDKDNYIKFEDDTWLDLDPTMKLKPAFDVKEGEKVKVLIIKEV